MDEIVMRYFAVATVLLTYNSQQAAYAINIPAIPDFLPSHPSGVWPAEDTDTSAAQAKHMYSEYVNSSTLPTYNRFPYDDIPRDYCSVSGRFGGLLDCEYCRELWKDTMRVAVNGSLDEYVYLVTQLGNATVLPFLYERNDPRFSNFIPRGYKLIDIAFPMLANSTGMHAFALQSTDDARKVVITIRYTNAGILDFDNLDGRADICAGYWLTRISDIIPAFCADFTIEELNYLDQLADFTEKVLATIRADQDNVCFLYSGYSIGNWIAQLASLAFHSSMPGIGFGSPGTYFAAKNLNIPPGESSGLVDFYWGNDPIVRMEAFWTNKTGYLCPCPNDPTPEYCERCYVDNNFDFMNDTNSCAQCYGSEHRVRLCDPRAQCTYVEIIDSSAPKMMRPWGLELLCAVFIIGSWTNWRL